MEYTRESGMLGGAFNPNQEGAEGLMSINALYRKRYMAEENGR